METSEQEATTDVPADDEPELDPTALLDDEEDIITDDLPVPESESESEST
jgi:hypothetical protein